MKQLLRQNIRQIAAAAAAFAILLWLFGKAQPVDPDRHNLVVSDLAELEKMDTELGEAVLQLHYNLANNYDAAVFLMQRIQALGVVLEQHHKRGLLPDTPDVRRELAVLHSRIQKKAVLLEEFKSGNAVMKNALIYLPEIVNAVLEKLPPSKERLIEKFEIVLRDALLVSIKSDDASIDALETDIVNIGKILPVLPVDAQESARHVVRHAQSLMEMDRLMPELLAGLSAYQAHRLGADLETLYQNYYQQQQRTAVVYRLFLLLATLVMLVYSIYVYIRLKAQRQQLASALAQVNNQQQALNEHAIVSITDVKGDITYVNDKFINISGYTSEELIGQNHRMIQSGHHSREFYRDLWQTVASGRVWHGQVKNRTRDGAFYWVEATVVPFMDQAGKPYQYVSMRTDITAQKDMEQQLLSERRLLQNVMDTLGEGVFMLDLKGNCTYLNREAEAIVGWTSDEVLGRNLHDIIHSQLQDGTPVAQEDCPVQQATLADTLYRSESEYFQHKNGTLFPIAIVAQPMKDGNEIFGTVAAFQDISERKFFERELLRAKDDAEAASRAKGNFLATMSHEIRTPMNGIIGMTELTLDTDLNPLQREYLNMVKSSSDALLTIINDVLDFSKIESGKMELELVEFDVRSLFSSTEKSLAFRAWQRGVELVYDVDSDIPDMLVGDPGRIRQVIINLLGNAIKFSDHGAISLQMKLLKAAANAVMVHIEVADQGIGISAEKQSHIFEAFTQADTSTTRKYGGTGLGLAISSQLVEAMGGVLSVRSELGQGSVFSFVITLPVGKNALQSSTGLDGLSALIVDDNALNRQLLNQYLGKWGMKTIAASSASQALALMQDAQSAGATFDLLLLDASMPEMDGFALVNELQNRQISCRGAVMMLSSAGLSADMERCGKSGIPSYFSKPVEQSELLSAIHTALGIKADSAAISRDRVPTPGLDILLAEDNRVNQKLAVALLEKWGYRVVLANNGVEAVEKSREQSFDAILMDLQMPEMGGMEATQLIREHDRAAGRHTRIIAMTANAMSEDRQLCLDAGMDDYLSKPLNTEKMRAMLQGLPPRLQETQPAISTFDYAAALSRTDEWVIETIGQAFLDESDVLLVEMGGAIEAGNGVLLMRSAHTLRGLAGNFNAKGVEDVARQIEKFAEQGNSGEAAQSFNKLQGEMAQLKSALVDCLGSNLG